MAYSDKTYEQKEILKLHHVEAIKLRNKDGDYTKWLNINDYKKEKAIIELFDKGGFSFYFNMLERHNGYTNIFTYLLAVEIDSDGDLMNLFIPYGRENGAYELEKYMKNYFTQEKHVDLKTTGFNSLLACAFDCVNFTELAQKLTSEE